MPFWLSPRQICIIKLANKYLEYRNKIKSEFSQYHDNSTETFNKKIRNAEKLKFNYILVVGEKEEESNMVNVRMHKKNLGMMDLNQLKEIFEKTS